MRSCQEPIDDFLRIAKAGLERLYLQISDAGYVILLSDVKGRTVDEIINPSHDRELKEAGLYLGAVWAENEEGTCGVGTCIATQQALTIHKSEHFRARHIDLTCTDVPVFDPFGNLIAVIDVSALYSPDGRTSQRLVYHLVNKTARLIVTLVSLRERTDKGLLIEQAYAAESGSHSEKIWFDEEAFTTLLNYQWPGNIRQLRNAVRYSLAVCEDSEIKITDLPPEVTRSVTSHPTLITPLIIPPEQVVPPAVPLMDAASAMGNETLMNTLRQHKWNITTAVRKLGMSRSTIYRKMKSTVSCLQTFRTSVPPRPP